MHIMKRKLKQWWLITIPPISTKQTTSNHWTPKQKHDVWCRKSIRSYIVVWDMHKNVYTLFTIDYGMILHYSSVSVSSSSMWCKLHSNTQITTYAINAYHQWCCEFESRSGWGVQHYVIKFVSDLRQVGGFLRFPPPIKLIASI